MKTSMRQFRKLTGASLALAAALAALSHAAGLLDRIGARASAAPAALATFVVNSTTDGGDANTSDGVCDDGAGRCTLRAAIQQANASPGADLINFAVGSGAQTIAVGSPLPAVTDPLTIDATTQPGFSGAPLVVLHGGGLSTGVVGDGLIINAGGSAVRGLVVNGFRGHGLRIEGGSGTVVAGNYIGLDASGAARASNLQSGVLIVNSSNNTVGGTGPAARNVISGNFANGVHVAGPSATGNVVAGNYIGTNAAGTASVQNDSGVLFFNGASGNTVGGTTAAARNVISGNAQYGVNAESGTSGNLIQGNYIGTNAAGTAAVANGSDGVRLGGTNNVLGGPAPAPGSAPGNLVSGQHTNVFIIGGGAAVQGNLIGLDPAGTSALIQASFGITCWGPNALIGGAQTGARNVISGHAVNIDLANSGANATIQGNYIGTDVNGATAVRSADSVGVRLGTQGNLVGGTTPAARNVISGNLVGVVVNFGSSAVKGNFIGTNAAGDGPVPNDTGVMLTFTTNGAVVGGDEPGAANVIAFNTGNGVVAARDVFVQDSFTSNNSVRRNSIFSNGLLGIDLFGPGGGRVGGPPGAYREGVTPNDAGDADNGPNGLQNFPAVTTVTTSGGAVNVAGTLNSKPNASYTIDFYANAACDASGHGEGQAHAGSAAVTTDAAGNASFSAALAPPPGAGSVFTATATDAAGNTSEFSVCHEAGAPGTFQFTTDVFQVNEGAGAATVTVTRTLGSAGAASVDYSTGDGTARAGEDYAHASGTLHFAPGETTKTFTVNVLDDSLSELPETVNLTLSNPTGGVALGAQSAAVVRILDADPPPTMTIEGAAVTEGDSGTTDVLFTVRLSTASGRAVTVDYLTQGGTATPNQDYATTFGTLTFAPGETVKTVAVPVVGDTLIEFDEFFSLRLFGPSGASFQNNAPFLAVAGQILDDDGTPGIRFPTQSFIITEGAGSILITVVRRGDASAAASVEYATSDGTASDRSDYTPAFGRLDFAPGEAEKTFVVLLTDDSFVEGPETVTLTLSNATGSPLGTPSQATLTIVGGEAAGQGNPIDNPSFFVRQHYHDFLNRVPDPAGFQFWLGQLVECGGDAACTDFRRVSVSQAFFLSIEFQRTGFRVIRVYKASFTDSPARPRGLPRLTEFLRDTQEIGRGVVVGQGDWEQRLQQNTLDYARRWVARADFLAEFPETMSAQAYVDKLFQNSEVTPTDAERAAAVAAFGAGGVEGRAQALLSVTGSGSVYNRQYNPAAVLMQYFGYLRRNPNDAPEPGLDFAGYDFWLGKLNDHSLPGEDVRDEETARRRLLRAEMVRSFLVSGEYRGRFGEP